ncbi:Epoxyqueuosine reductase [uncultured archaeon]|nr:Epoxyqueuosine reductase [uncultured archaeon]
MSSNKADLMNEDLLEAVRQRCWRMEIPLVGVADVRRWESPPFLPWMPEEFYPHSIFPEARSVIVIGLPISLPVLETSPSIYYRELYATVNVLLDQYTYRLSNFLCERGHPSIFVPRDGYSGIQALLKNPMAFFSVRHAAFLAGLGSFGVNNMLLTPRYGPRVRFGAVLTAAALPSDPLQMETLCNRCMRCVKMCPAGALGEKDYPQGLTDRMSCARHSAELNRRGISPCGICIKVCPVGEDRELFGRQDASIYSKKERFSEGHKAWEHVQSYGGL